MSVEYAIIVKNKTRLEALIERFNTQAQAKFYIERSGGNFQDYVIEHDVFCTAFAQIQQRLSSVIKNKVVDRSFLPNYLFNEKNVIIVVGQDGLVANTAKYSKAVPIVAVNPDPKRYDGVLLPFNQHNFITAVERVLTDQYAYRMMRFAEAKLNDGQRLLAFNDLFIGAASHVSARYKISYRGETEEHSSSGLLVSTKAGATGWLSSVFNMAYGVASMFESMLEPRQPELADDDLLFVVREPFKSLRTQTQLSLGKINGEHSLVIESLMPSNGVIFSDGIETDFLKFNSGMIATIGLAQEQAKLVLRK
jgi:NAD kinase